MKKDITNWGTSVFDLDNNYYDTDIVSEGFGDKVTSTIQLLKKALAEIWKKITEYATRTRDKIKRMFKNTQHRINLGGRGYNLSQVEDLQKVYNEYVEYQNREVVCGPVNHTELIIPSLKKAIETIQRDIYDFIDQGISSIMKEDYVIDKLKIHSLAAAVERRNNIDAVLANVKEEYDRIVEESKAVASLTFSEMSTVGKRITIVDLAKIVEHNSVKDLDELAAVFKDEAVFLQKVERLNKSNLNANQRLVLEDFTAQVRDYIQTASSRLMVLGLYVSHVKAMYAGILFEATNILRNILVDEGGMSLGESSFSRLVESMYI